MRLQDVKQNLQKPTIDQHVTKILKEVLQTEKFEESNIEKTANTYTFIGNLKKPFHVLHWLTPKGIPVKQVWNTRNTSRKERLDFYSMRTKMGLTLRVLRL